MESFLIASLISLVLIIVCVVIFYEILAHVWVSLPKLEGRPRTQILVTVLSAFLGHTIVVWIFGVTFYLLEHHFKFGALTGKFEKELINYVYFSGVTYTSLGLGDIYPQNELRLLIAVEALTGLILIGWTVTFTYLVTEKYLAHKRERRHGKR